MFKNIAIILVNPQLGENIGSVARIMANFAFSDLRIVSPRDGWPNERAKVLAAGGIDIIDNAKIYKDLDNAIADLSELYACSARVRKMNKEIYNLKEHMQDVEQNNIISNKLGIMFGSERSGLLNEQIIYAKKVINIKTNSEYGVLNLAQAVALICYEYFSFKIFQQVNKKDNLFQDNKASLEEVNFLLTDLKDKLAKKEVFKDEERQAKMYQNIHNIFIRNNLSKQEVRTLLGVIKILNS